MKILILGGTRFLGRALVDSARAAGHTLTLFNRGQSNPGLFADVEQIIGDRAHDLDRLAGRQWDVVIDTCGYVPSVVRRSAGALADAVASYVFISSISVYADVSRPGVDEQAPLEPLPAGADETKIMEHYGALKALCEQAVAETLPGRALLIRPGLIVGPHDPTDRFSYWVDRAARGGTAVAPGSPDYLTQFIDVRDLADWTVRLVEAGAEGVYNATGPRQPVPLGALLETCQAASAAAGGAGTHFAWLPEAFLVEQGVQPWSDLPLYLPESDPAYAGANQVSIARALAAGLTFRPLADTVAATLAWLKTRPAGHEWRAGLSPEREQGLLRAAQARGLID